MRVVVKVGSNILADSHGLNSTRIDEIASAVFGVIGLGHEVVIVSSGAVAAGMRKLGMKTKPKEIMLKQAAAAVGQSSLMWAYEKSFSHHAKNVAQVLLTAEDLSDRRRYMNARNTLLTLLGYGVVPVINENDTVATNEIKFGDNDQLAVLVASLIGADRLIILSDVDGLYSEDPKKNPKAGIIETVTAVTEEIKTLAGGEGSAVGTGGMYSKILAAEKAMKLGVAVNIISGKHPAILLELMQGHRHGTEFLSGEEKLSARKGWIAYGVKAKGGVKVDDGARSAIIKLGKSLLPSGVLSVEGKFDTGSAIYCFDKDGLKIAKGLANYSSDEMEAIMGKKTSDIERILGYKYSDEIIHRDNLVLLIEEDER